jgi:hypothetical protein
MFALFGQRVHERWLRSAEALGALPDEAVALETRQVLADRIRGDALLLRQLESSTSPMALQRFGDAAAGRLKKA